jgi:DNA-binding CsgD family transcriptional regulator
MTSLPMLVGRDQLVTELAASLAGSNPVMVLEGEPGVGKTSVWAALRDSVSADWKWSVGCLEAEFELGLVTLADFFSSVPEDVKDTLTAPLRRAVDVVLFIADPVEAAGLDSDRLLCAATAALLRELTNRGSVLLAIDDAQWCDRSSLQALSFALHRVRDGVTVLANVRAGDELDLPRATHVDLPPLADSEIRALVCDQAAARSIAEIDQMVVSARGNPFFAMELAKSPGAGRTESPLPGSLRTALRHRLDGLPAGCWPVMLDVAVRGAPPVSDLDLAALDPAFTTRIVTLADGFVRFTHPLIGRAALDRATPAARRDAYARAASASKDPIATALFRAKAEGPSVELAQSLADAADVAQRRGDLNSARTLLGLALDNTPGDGRPAELLMRLMQVEMSLGHDDALELARELAPLAETTDQTMAAECHIASHIVDDVEAGQRIMALTELPNASSDLVASCVVTAAERFRMAGYANDVIERWLAEHDSSNEHWLRMRSELAFTHRLFGPGVDLDGLLADIANGPPSDTARFVFEPGNLAVIAYLDDRHDLADRLLRETADASARNGCFDGSSMFRQLLQLRTGKIAEAIAGLRHALDETAGYYRVLPLSRLAYAVAWQGDETGASRLLLEADALADPDDHGYHAEYAFAKGFHLLLTHHFRDASTWLLRSLADLDQIGQQEPLKPPALPHAIQAAAALDDIASAEELCSRLEEQSRLVSSPGGLAAVQAGRGYIAEARRDEPTAERCFRAAIEAFTDLGAPLEAARVRLALGSLLRRSGQRRRAREELIAARAVFAECGVHGLANETDAEVRRISGRSASDSAELTESERQVAALVATGLRNADVAEKLHLSIKTVETHLGRAFRKLGVTNRAELARQFPDSYAPA